MDDNNDNRFGPISSMGRDTFVGSPKITSDKNAKDLKPRAYDFLKAVDHEDFPIKGLTAKYHPDGAAVFDGDSPVASYNFGNTLVVDPKYRRKGIGEELVYQWRTRFPGPSKATHRTKASQAIQEKVWDRINREKKAKGGSASQGYDGWVPHRMGGNLVVALKHLGQIKSALSNTGEYGENADINKAEGGPVDDEQGIIAYHGSPHDFDQFDISKIGTGEGAQVYGPGLYFAQREGIARHYRDTLSDKTWPEWGEMSSPGEGTYATRIAKIFGYDGQSFDRNGRNISDIARRFSKEKHDRGNIITYEFPDGSAYHETSDGWDISGPAKTTGHMYEVHINANPDDHLIDWDETIHNQNDRVRRAFGWTPEMIDRYKNGEKLNHLTDLHEKAGDVINKMDNDDLLKLMRQHDVRGIKYFDGNSRSAGEGTRNYVVFDDKHIGIRRKYKQGGRVGYATGGAPGMENEEEDVLKPKPLDVAPLPDPVAPTTPMIGSGGGSGGMGSPGGSPATPGRSQAMDTATAPGNAAPVGGTTPAAPRGSMATPASTPAPAPVEEARSLTISPRSTLETTPAPVQENTPISTRSVAAFSINTPTREYAAPYTPSPDLVSGLKAKAEDIANQQMQQSLPQTQIDTGWSPQGFSANLGPPGAAGLSAVGQAISNFGAPTPVSRDEEGATPVAPGTAPTPGQVQSDRTTTTGYANGMVSSYGSAVTPQPGASIIDGKAIPDSLATQTPEQLSGNVTPSYANPYDGYTDAFGAQIAGMQPTEAVASPANTNGVAATGTMIDATSETTPGAPEAPGTPSTPGSAPTPGQASIGTTPDYSGDFSQAERDVADQSEQDAADAEADAAADAADAAGAAAGPSDPGGPAGDGGGDTGAQNQKRGGRIKPRKKRRVSFHARAGGSPVVKHALMLLLRKA